MHHGPQSQEMTLNPKICSILDDACLPQLSDVRAFDKAKCWMQTDDVGCAADKIIQNPPAELKSTIECYDQVNRGVQSFLNLVVGTPLGGVCHVASLVTLLCYCTENQRQAFAGCMTCSPLKPVKSAAGCLTGTFCALFCLPCVAYNACQTPDSEPMAEREDYVAYNGAKFGSMD